ncbi:DUF86 domain-containing protein [Trichocoleus sp. FACHB-591]|uniref:HepT-like ribonuclease domain-containing protein n=1 Tax=Trichocoleus sp. FACHB-591 TaxID=2692872 RepID=UPI0016842E91|nr:HepT-like ribonuclease domain-containing protein [Trichocoleus sp. FACHB-591]MBD2097670.1 DUF86 domain-containing protein [Trichocoleus sp. FACHB-591]
MQINDRDAASLWDMAQAIRRILEFTQNSSLEGYLNSIFMQSAVERQFEILGEAARRISLEFQQLHPEIDWSNIIGLRNVIAHRYEQVNQENLWQIVEALLPDLLIHVEGLLPPLPEEDSL